MRELAEFKRYGVKHALARRKEETNYLKYLAFNGLIELEKGMRAEVDKRTALTVVYRKNDMLMGLVGFVCTALGIGLAIRARACLGRKGSATATGRENPELITTGPYALVRHPLYSGMLLAMLGSAIGQSVLWLLPLIVYGPYFIRGARREEKLLIEQFPDRYRAYMKRTKMLLPFVL